jgi:putative ABC transport system permease protein
VLAAIALSPVLARPFARVVGAVLPRVWGATGHLARENALRNPRRPAATASALMVGLALVSAFTVIGASTNASVDKLVGSALSADFVVSTAVGQPFAPEVADDLREVEGVRAVMQERLRRRTLRRPGVLLRRRRPGDARPHAAARLRRRQHRRAGGRRRARRRTDRRVARLVGGRRGPDGAAEGDRVDLTVGGVYASNQAVGPYVISLETHAATGGTPLDRYVYVYVDVDDDADLAAVRSAMAEAVATYPVVDLKDTEEFAEEQREQVGQLLLLINALLVLSVIIAVLGIVNTLALSVIERTREIGLLRAVGLSRPQLRRMVRLESVVISVYGAALGLALGTVFGVSLTRALSGQGIEVLVVPGARLAAFLLVGAVIGVLAAVWPAR